MQQDFTYRDYLVWHDGKEVVAEEIGNDDEPLFQIGSPSLDEAIIMIDEMHDAVETNVVPIWFQNWMHAVNQKSTTLRARRVQSLHAA